MGSQTRRTSERFVCSTGRLTSARFFMKKLSAISRQLSACVGFADSDSSSSKITGDLSRLVWLQFQPNLQRPRRHQPAKTLAPFDQRHRVLLENLIETQRFHFALPTEPVKHT